MSNAEEEVKKLKLIIAWLKQILRTKAEDATAMSGPYYDEGKYFIKLVNDIDRLESQL